MTTTFRNLAFGAALCAGVFAFQDGLAQSSSGPSSQTPSSGSDSQTPPSSQTPKQSASNGDHRPESKDHKEGSSSSGHPHDSGKGDGGKGEGDQGGANPGGQPSGTGQPAENAPPPITTNDLAKEYGQLPPETRDALMKTIQSKGIDGISNMTEAQARETFSSLPDNVREQLQSKWDNLSDEQRVQLKKMGPQAIKDMFASQMKQVVKQSMDPVVKPVEAAVASTQAAVTKATTTLQKARDYVQGLLAKFRTGSGSSDQAQSGTTDQPPAQTSTTQ
jgi:hypothetical protein